eukprot:m.872706 g.872706  ORF g.872706 m.872706 type:complete len:518 (+) comp59780_c0_seq1:1642-3195(+)
MGPPGAAAPSSPLQRQVPPIEPRTPSSDELPAALAMSPPALHAVPFGPLEISSPRSVSPYYEDDIPPPPPSVMFANSILAPKPVLPGTDSHTEPNSQRTSQSDNEETGAGQPAAPRPVGAPARGAQPPKSKVAARMSSKAAGSGARLQRTGTFRHAKDARRGWSWVALGTDLAGAKETLQNRSAGAFVVRSDAGGDQSQLWLCYKHSSNIYEESIQIERTADGKPNVYLTRSPSLVFDTVQDLVSFFGTARPPLHCALKIADLFLALDGSITEDGVAWSWFMLGASEVHARRVLDGLSRGAFAVCSHHSSNRKLLLLYNTEFNLEQEEISIQEAPSGAKPKFFFSSRPDVLYDDLHDLLWACRAETPLLKCELTFPALQVAQPRLRHDNIGLRGLQSRRVGDQSWNWWQLRLPLTSAVELLRDKPNGAFVITRNPSKARAYVLVYKFGGKIFQEGVSHTPNHDLIQRGVHLDVAQHEVFQTLHDLVAYYETRAGHLQCRLTVSERPPPDLSPEIPDA